MIKGTGTAIAFQSGLFGEILNANRTGMSRAAIQTSHFGTTGSHTYMPAALVEPGQWEIEAGFDPTDDIQAIMGATGETVTVTHTDGAGTKHATQGFATEFEEVIPFEDRVTCTFTLKLSGNTTYPT